MSEKRLQQCLLQNRAGKTRNSMGALYLPPRPKFMRVITTQRRVNTAWDLNAQPDVALPVPAHAFLKRLPHDSRDVGSPRHVIDTTPMLNMSSSVMSDR